MSELSGKELSAASQRQSVTRQAESRYAAVVKRILGCDLDSEEFNRRLDMTIANM